jgi:hypothetical protein
VLLSLKGSLLICILGYRIIINVHTETSNIQVQIKYNIVCKKYLSNIHVQRHYTLQETTKYSSVLTDGCMNEIGENPKKYNSDEYNKLYSSVPRNVSVYSLETCNR